MRFLIPVLAILTLGLAGCSSYVPCAVDARAPYASRKKVFIDAIPPKGEDPLRYDEFRAILRRALLAKGFEILDSNIGAASFVRFEYGMIEPSEISDTRSSFAYKAGEQTGMEGESSTRIIRRPVANLGVTAFDAKGEKILWRVDVGSEGPSKNLRHVFPYMVLAASDWFGKSNAVTTYRQVREGSADFLLYDGPVPEIGPWERPDSAR